MLVVYNNIMYKCPYYAVLYTQVALVHATGLGSSITHTLVSAANVSSMPACRFRQWANVVCVDRRDKVWHALMEGMAAWIE